MCGRPLSDGVFVTSVVGLYVTRGRGAGLTSVDPAGRFSQSAFYRRLLNILSPIHVV